MEWSFVIDLTPLNSAKLIKFAIIPLLHGFYREVIYGQVAQSVEQRTLNLSLTASIFSVDLDKIELTVNSEYVFFHRYKLIR